MCNDRVKLDYLFLLCCGGGSKIAIGLSSCLSGWEEKKKNMVIFRKETLLLLGINMVTLNFVEVNRNYIYEGFFIFHGIMLAAILVSLYLKYTKLAYLVSVIYLYMYTGHLLWLYLLTSAPSSSSFFVKDQVDLFVMSSVKDVKRHDRIASALYENTMMDFTIVKNKAFNHSAGLKQQFELFDVDLNRVPPHVFKDKRYEKVEIKYVLNVIKMLQTVYDSSNKTFVLVLEDDAKVDAYLDEYVHRAIQLYEANKFDVILLSSINFARPFWNAFRFQLFGLQGVLYRRESLPLIIALMMPGSSRFFFFFFHY